jgi:hypothetical protein
MSAASCCCIVPRLFHNLKNCAPKKKNKKYLRTDQRSITGGAARGRGCRAFPGVLEAAACSGGEGEGSVRGWEIRQGSHAGRGRRPGATAGLGEILTVVGLDPLPLQKLH